ncbi:acyl-CoA dehydrogenase [Actinophytocola xinjiangensis]|uniref:Acyl-CoA dehydrogenase n=1 Tax=Actinophytocola xinjiangensis TaxID=485602 RepID=A0A7Z0WG46_9PSEU|nr:acyl-CoA dehydrogenase [Actinophytocola xinjiangensis]
MTGLAALARTWLAANVPAQPLPPMDTEAGFAAHRAWEHRLAEARLSTVSWPAAYGGRDASVREWLAVEQEYWAAGAPARVSGNGIALLGSTLLTHGTAEQRARILPAMSRADEIWAQAWSEPEAGSDLAAVRATATRTDGGWLLSGQKTWSSRAAFADRAFGLFRSGARRHHGLTYLMFDLRAPGVTVRPITQLTGTPGFAEIFLDDVFVPDRDVIGEPGDGWRIAMSTAGRERGLTLRAPGRFLAAADRLLDLWRARPDPALRDDVVDAWIGARAYHLHTLAGLDSDAAPGAEASLTKVFWSELDLTLHETALSLLGADAELDAPWRDAHLFALAGPIYAGTNEIQRTVIAERLLGLPR